MKKQSTSTQIKQPFMVNETLSGDRGYSLWEDFNEDFTGLNAPCPDLPDELFTEDDSGWSESIPETPRDYPVDRDPDVVLIEARRLMQSHTKKDQFIEALRTNFSPGELRSCHANIKKAVQQELGLLGSVYYDRSLCENCQELIKLLSNQDLTPSYLLKIKACDGCVNNQNGLCTLIDTKITDKVLFPYQMVDRYLSDLASVNTWYEQNLNQYKSNDYDRNQKLLQTLLQATPQGSTSYATSVAPSGIFIQSQAEKDAVQPSAIPPVIEKVIRQAIKMGTNLVNVKNYLEQSHIYGKYFQKITAEQLIAACLNSSKVVNPECLKSCNTSLNLLPETRLVRVEKCTACTMNSGKQCKKFGRSFINPVEVSTVTDESNRFGTLEDKIKQALHRGFSIKKIHAHLEKIGALGGIRFSDMVNACIRELDLINPDIFDSCPNNLNINSTARIVKKAKCDSCTHNNNEVCCNQLRAVFDDPVVAEQPENVRFNNDIEF